MRSAHLKREALVTFASKLNTLLLSALLLLSAFTSFSSISATSSDKNYSARINGVTDFLIERAQGTALYLYEQSIRENENLQCYFPTTYETLNSYQQGTLKIFISSKAQWQNAMQNDMETLLVRSFAKEIEDKVGFGKKQVPIANTVINIMQQLELKYTTKNGATAYTPLTLSMLDADVDSTKIQKAFYQPFEDLIATLKVFEDYTPNANGQICDLPRFNYLQFENKIKGLTSLPNRLQAWLEHVKKHKADLRPSTQLLTQYPSTDKAWQAICKIANTKNPASCANVDDFVSQLTTLYSLPTNFDPALYLQNDIAVLPNSGEFAKLLADYKNMIKPIQQLYKNIKSIQAKADGTRPSTSELAQQALALIKKWWAVQHGNSANINTDAHNQALWKLSKHIQFFALLSDANTADEVKGILSTFALPQTGFWQKRDSHSHLMVTSYFGAAYNTQSATIDEANSKNHNNGFYVPVGLEYTFDKDWLGLNEGAVSLMVSPFDFGYPINLKLNGIEQDFEVDEIFAPSISISYGLQKWPLVLGVAYQKGAKFSADSDSENRTLLFVAFDMPLFNLM
ncbi:hypothetical protein N9W11_07440 [Psychrosphaera haliotis]|nr:hypothetical protein [Psychrosphaera haliotis]